MPLNKKDITQIKGVINEGQDHLVKVFRSELGTTEKRLQKFVHEEIGSTEKRLEKFVHEVVHSEIENLARIVAKGFTAVDEQFEQVDRRFERVDASLANLEAKLDTTRHDVAVIKEHFVYRNELERVVERLVVVERKVVTRK